MKPLFRYMGGKTWLSKHLKKQLICAINKNKNLDSYCEPFAGGMGSLISALETISCEPSLSNIKKIYVNDINPPLITVYKTIYEGGAALDSLLNDYKILLDEFNSTLPINGNKDKGSLEDCNLFFKKIRDKFNLTKEPVYLIILQQLSFNGIYRENLKGDYNTPFGWKHKPLDYSKFEASVLSMAEFLKNFDMIFTIGDYKNVMDIDNCLYYLDPPYFNTDGTKESSYSSGGFGIDEQKVLIEKLTGKKYFYSNHLSVSMFELFKDEHKDMLTFERANRVSSGDRSSERYEMLVFNY